MSPLVATITGSTTAGPGKLARRAATAAMIAAVPSIPVLTAPTARSSNTLAICASTNGAAIISTAWTPRVFCAVSAVSTDAP